MELQEKKMEIGFAGFLFFVAWNGGGGRKNKDENGNVLAGQAGVEVVGLVQKDMRWDVLAG